MGRKVGGTTKHTKVRKPLPNTAGNAVAATTTRIPKNTNISKHPKVHRQTPNYKTTTYSSGLKHTQGVHGASYGVTQHQQARDIQQKQRTNTVNLAHRIRYTAKQVAKPATNVINMAFPITNALKLTPESVRQITDKQHLRAGHDKVQANTTSVTGQTGQKRETDPKRLYPDKKKAFNPFDLGF